MAKKTVQQDVVFRSPTKRIKIKDGHVYSDDKIQKGIDAETCVVIFPAHPSEPFDGVYLRDKDAVYFFDPNAPAAKMSAVKVTEDFKNFSVLDDGKLSRDDAHIYLKGQALPEVDAATFELIPSLYFARDKNHVYYHAGHKPYFKTLLYADPKSFIAFKNEHGSYSEFGSDKDNLYYLWTLSNDNKFNERDFERIGSFTQSHQNLKDYWWGRDYDKKPEDAKPMKSFRYFRSKTAVFTRHKWDSIHGHQAPDLITGADPRTFEPLTEAFSRDKNSLFYFGYLVPDINPQKVKIFSQDDSWMRVKYVGDDKHVCCITIQDEEFYSFIIEGADPKTFTAIDSTWAEDRNCKYKNGKPHKSDKLVTKIIKYNHIYSSDGQTVFWGSKAIPSSDVKTFQLVFEDDPNSWAKDCHHLYNANGRRVVKGIDGASFEMLDSVYGKDKTSVFNFITGSVMGSADVKSFEVIPHSGLARDRTCFYFLGKKVSANKYGQVLAEMKPLLDKTDKLISARRNYF